MAPAIPVNSGVRPKDNKLTLTAKRTEQRRLRRGTGLETLVDIVAIAFLILGAIVAIGFLLTFKVWA